MEERRGAERGRKEEEKKRKGRRKEEKRKFAPSEDAEKKNLFINCNFF